MQKYIKTGAIGILFNGAGIILAGSQGTAQNGLKRMRRALGNGIERYMPIEDEIKQQLLSSH